MTLTARKVDQHERRIDIRRVFAFHMHGDFSLEWVQCLALEERGPAYAARTVLFPTGMNEV